jgi:hypothetical protein
MRAKSSNWWDDPRARDEYDRRYRQTVVVPTEVEDTTPETHESVFWNTDPDAHNPAPTWGPKRGSA